MARRLFKFAALIGVTAVAAANLPDLARYLRIRNM
jgi:hypothetical protein